MFADKYFLFPVVMIALIGVLVLLVRWTSPGRSQSLVRRTDPSPAAHDEFGLLVEVCTNRRREAAQQVMAALANASIRATCGRTEQGWTVYVWPVDEDTAKAVARRAMPRHP